MASPSSSSFSVFVRCPSSKSAYIEACGWEEVGEVCRRGLVREGFDRLDPYTQVYISYGGRPVQARATLEKAGVQALCTLHIHPNPAAISSRLSLRDRVEGLPDRLQRQPTTLAEELDGLNAALEEVVEPLESGSLSTVAIGTMHGVFEPLAALCIQKDHPDVSELGFAWLERTVSALETQFSLALDQVPEQLYPARLSLVAALECLLPLLLHKLGGSSTTQCDRIAWAAEALRPFAVLCRGADLALREAPADPALGSQQQAEKLLGQLAFGLARLVGFAADNAQAAASGLPASLHTLEASREHLDAAMDGISSLASLLSCFNSAGGVPAWPAGLEGSEDQLGSWLLLKATLFEPMQVQLTRLVRALESVPSQLGLDAAAPAAAGAALPDAVAAHVGRASRWLAQLLATIHMCIQAVCAPGSANSMEACYQGMAAVLRGPVMQAVLQDARGYRVLPPDVLLVPELSEVMPTAAKLYHLGRWAAGRVDAAVEADDEEYYDECDTLVVKRGQDLLESSYAELLPVWPAHLHSGLRVEFEGEPAHGAGVVREWLTLLAPRLFQPERGLFVRAGGNPLAILPSSAACVQPNHKEYLRVAGRVMGLAVLHGVPLGFHLASAFYKGLAGRQAELGDLAEADPQLAQSLQSVAAAEDPAGFGLTFTLCLDQLGQSVEVPLGDDPAQPVTAANRREYARLAVCPTSLFSLAALNGLLAGSGGGLCAQQWRQHTRCLGWEGWRGLAHGGDEMEMDGSAEPQEPEVLRWFWMLVGAMREQQRAALLRFWTSLPSLPFGGFGGLPQPLTLVRAEPSSQRLPQAHTCFYELVLPDYPDVLALAGGLAEAVAHTEGFGMA